MSEKPLLIIQARMSSKRLPQKMLMAMEGVPVIGHVLDSIKQLKECCDIVLATSSGADDDPLAAYAASAGVEVFRGDLQNVASRFLELCREKKPGAFVRVNGDSPLIDHRVIERAIELWKTSRCDMVTSALDRSYPSGTNVEVVSASLYENKYGSFSKPEHFEHVTSYFYEHPGELSIVQLPPIVANGSSYKLSLDSESDLALLRQLFEKLARPHYTYTLSEKCLIYDQVVGRNNRLEH